VESVECSVGSVGSEAARSRCGLPALVAVRTAGTWRGWLLRHGGPGPPALASQPRPATCVVRQLELRPGTVAQDARDACTTRHGRRQARPLARHPGSRRLHPPPRPTHRRGSRRDDLHNLPTEAPSRDCGRPRMPHMPGMPRSGSPAPNGRSCMVCGHRKLMAPATTPRPPPGACRSCPGPVAQPGATRAGNQPRGPVDEKATP
jgi:hypothetical protein